MISDPEVASTDLLAKPRPQRQPKRPDWVFKTREGWIREGNNAALSTLMGTEPPLPSDLIKSDPFKRPRWRRDAEEPEEMKLSHFSAATALLNPAITTPSRRVGAADVPRQEGKRE